MVFKAILTKKDVKKLAEDLKKTFKKNGVKVSKLILFGSYAKGTPHPWSDVDICVVSPQFGKKSYDDMMKVSKISKQVSYLIEAHPLNPRDLENNIHPLAQEINTIGKKI